VFGSVSKRLLCPACADLVAVATYRRWPGYLVLVAADGTRIVPTMGAVAREQAAGSAEDLAFVEAHPLDLIFRLRCPRGHPVLRTAPQLRRALRGSAASWVRLPDG